MTDAIVLLKIAAVVVAVLFGLTAVISFVSWQNLFRDIKPLFAIRLVVALIAYAWFLYFLPGGAA